MANVTEAYAVFDSDAGSLTFFRDEEGKYINGETRGALVYYTGVESTGTTSASVPWLSQRENVTSVSFRDIIRPMQTAYWFDGMEGLISITGLEKLDTSRVTKITNMFYYCSRLVSLDVSHFDTSQVSNMHGMFFHCLDLTSLDVSHFDTSQVRYMSRMFEACGSITFLDLTHFDTSNVTDINYMFYACQKLTTTLNIMKMPDEYTAMCLGAADRDGAKITLKYISPVTSANVNTLVATKATNSNVVNGGQGTFVPPIPPVPPTPPISDEDKYLPKTLFNRVFSKVKDYIDTQYSYLQEKLVSGTNIKTINNASLLGSGNIDINVEPFIVYSDTSYVDIKAAVDAKRPIVFAWSHASNSSMSPVVYYKSSIIDDIGYVVIVYQVSEVDPFKFERRVYRQNGSSSSVFVTELQSKLVSGTNIKTINNESLLGSGNIDIPKGGYFVESNKVRTYTYDELKAAIDNGIPFFMLGPAQNTITPLDAYVDSNDDNAILLKYVNPYNKTSVISLKWLSSGSYAGYTIDFGYVKESDLATKQDTLVSGINIKTINNESLLGSGNIDIRSGSNINILEKDVSTFGDVSNAVTSGDPIFIKYKGNIYPAFVYDTHTTYIDLGVLSRLNTIRVVDKLRCTNTSEWIVSTFSLQDKLTSGSNIKTINNQSLLGSGNIDIPVVDVDSSMSDTSENAVQNKIIKGYIDSSDADLQSQIDSLGEMFRVKQWASNTLNVTIPTCTTEIANSQIGKLVFNLNDEEGALYQIVGMIAYEVFDAATGGNRINCWPVCQFTGNGQKELSVRFMCGGTSNKVAKRISGWVLLKRREV